MIALPAMALAGCAAPDMAGYPSLARRPIEQRAPVAAPAPVSAPMPALVSATLADAVRALAGDADRGNAAFASALAANRPAVAAGRGAAIGSEGWAVAERGLSRIEAARAPTMMALTELDRLTVGNNDAAATALIAGEAARVAAMVDAQAATLARLRPNP